MKCPKCANDTRVYDSRVISSTQTRRRICINCGHRYTTHEVIVQELAAEDEVKVAIAKAAEVKQKEEKAKASPISAAKARREARHKMEDRKMYSGWGDPDAADLERYRLRLRPDEY